jgi:hypothetical protein
MPVYDPEPVLSWRLLRPMQYQLNLRHAVPTAIANKTASKPFKSRFSQLYRKTASPGRSDYDTCKGGRV